VIFLVGGLFINSDVLWSPCSLRILFMFPLKMIMYPLIELEPTRKFNYRNDLLIRKRRQNYGQVDSKNLVAFSLPSFKIYSVNFLIKLDQT
jgi:hypothetical protein